MRRKYDFARLIDLIYEAAVDARAWAAAIMAIGAAISAPAMSLEIIDPDGKKPPFLVAPRTDPDWRRAFLERWATSNLIRERGLVVPEGEVYQVENLISRSEFDRSPFYNEFWAPQRMNFALFANAAKGNSAVAGVGFYRSSDEGRFGLEDERLLGALAPHLQRAVALNIRLGCLEMERDGAAEMLNRCEHGALLVDADAHILFANAAAEALLRDGKGLRAKDGRLAACVPTKTSALRSMIAGGKDGVPGGLLTLPRADRGSLALLILPLRAETAWLTQRPAAIVFVKDPEASTLPSRDEIRLLFGLTPAQASLAREILHGDGVQAAAERLGISRATARTHLLEVFQKTGTSRQAELVRVILQQSLPSSDVS